MIRKLCAGTVSVLFVLGAAWAQDPPGAPPPAGAPPGGMPVGPGGGPPGGGPPGGGPPGAPNRAALYIANGHEDTAKEYVAGKYRSHVTASPAGVVIDGLDLSSGKYSFTGVVANGEKSIVTLDNVKMHLGVASAVDAKAQGGSALDAGGGATIHLNHSQLTVDGAQRYVTLTDGNSTLIVNDSSITQTGSDKFTSTLAEPFSNNALYIYGNARANMSINGSKTYYFNSRVSTEGWAALSTDAAAPSGLNLYAYNTTAIAEHGGYGTYADFFCHVWLYGSRIESAEIGAIIAKSGEITIADGASAPAELLKLDTGAKTSEGSLVRAGRNAVMIHAPDMAGEGLKAADAGTLNVIRSTLVTDTELKSTRDYARYISPAAAAYIDYIKGADVLIKSTSGNFNFDGATLKSYSHVLVLTALNSDRMGNFLHAESDGAAVKPVAVSFRNMSVDGDIKHMDYQRLMTLSLEKTTLKGAIVSGSVADWNALWGKFEAKDTKWVQNQAWNTFYGVRLTLKAGSTWEASAPSTLSSLTVEAGATLKGKVQVDGKPVQPVSGQTYSGHVSVTPL